MTDRYGSGLLGSCGQDVFLLRAVPRSRLLGAGSQEPSLGVLVCWCVCVSRASCVAVVVVVVVGGDASLIPLNGPPAPPPTPRPPSIEERRLCWAGSIIHLLHSCPWKQRGAPYNTERHRLPSGSPPLIFLCSPERSSFSVWLQSRPPRRVGFS